MHTLRKIVKQLPTFLTAFVLAAVVWVIAVTADDPSLEKLYPNSVPIEIIGQSTDLVITDYPQDTVSLTLRAPASVWNTLIEEKAPVRALVDLSGMGEGEHTVPVQIEIGVNPVEVITFNPRSVAINLEKLASSQFDIGVTTSGSVAIGYQAGEPETSETTATVSGAASLVSQVAEVKAIVDIKEKISDVSDSIALKAYDQYGAEIKNVSISPEKVTVKVSVSQLGGFRNVVVKVVTEGQVAVGYRLTSILVDPPTVTVYSTDSALIESLPGYVETDTINLTGLKDDLNQEVNLRLNSNITVVGNPTVNVKVDVTTIENTQQFSDVTVQATGLDPAYVAQITPSRVDLIVTGPLVSLNSVNASELRLQIDLTGMTPGTYTFEPETSLNYPDLRIDSIFTTTFQVTITKAATTPTN